MAVLTKRTVVTIPRINILSIVFFACFYAYVWMVIEPYLIYYGFGIIVEYPEFSTGWGFFKGHLSHVSGLLEYVTGFLSHMFYYSWFGALTITAIAWLLSVGTVRLMRLSGTVKSNFIRYIPALFVLMMFNHYNNPLYTCLGILAGLWASILYEKISPKNIAGSIFIFIISLGVLYYIVGGGASIVFVLISGICVVLVEGKRLIGGSNLLVGTLMIFLFGIYLSPMSPTEAFFGMIGFEKSPEWSLELIPEICLYLFLPVLAAAVGLRDNLSSHKTGRADHKKSSSGKKSGSKKLRPVFQTAALAMAFFVTVFYSFDSRAKLKCRTIYLDRQEKWYGVMELISQLSSQNYNLFHNHFLNKALYFSGQLGDKMFFFPQQSESFLLSSKAGKGLKEFVGCHIFLRLGQVNLAEKKTHEIMENTGEHPQILKLLAQINIVKNQPETARMYLKALSKNLIYGGQGKDLLARLNEDPHQNTDPEVMHLRSIMLQTDSHFPDNMTEKLLLELFNDNTSNRMAFEYLMGHYLISGRLEKFANNISRLKDLNFNKIPVHYAEGILTYQSITGKKINMQGLIIPPEIIEEFKIFEEIHDDYKDKQTAAKALKARFGRCYYYYYTFYGTDIIP